VQLENADARAESWERRRQQQQQRAQLERERGARSATLADWHAARAGLAPTSVRPLHVRLAALHRRMVQRHLASAELHGLLAIRMDRWIGCPDGVLRPGFMAAIASALGTWSALAVLRGQESGVAVVGASDRIARAAHDLEIVTAEGPALEAARDGAAVMAAGPALLDRWPQYGPAVTELGVRAVAAAPLGLPGTRIGALCALGRKPEMSQEAVLATTRMADAFTRLLLRLTEPPRPDEESPVLPLLDGAGYLAVVHQAAGIVSVQCDCGIDDAQALLAMRAFADGAPLADIATQVVRGEIRFGELPSGGGTGLRAS
jgi:hypothetical protein